jgi:hypothetical protein
MPGVSGVIEGEHQEGVWADQERSLPCPNTHNFTLLEELMGQFRTSQPWDPDLHQVMRKVKRIDGRSIGLEGEVTTPYYAIKWGLLYWVAKRRGVEQDLLMVPCSYRDVVLHMY